jgi:hypothetical protein
LGDREVAQTIVEEMLEKYVALGVEKLLPEIVE